jgi:hypothetical protein
MNFHYISALVAVLLLVVLTTSGCSKTEVFTTNIYANCCGLPPLEMDLEPGKIYVPNIFTPDSNGVNDAFLLFADQDISEIVELRIISSGGAIVLERFSFAPENGLVFWQPDGGQGSGVYSFEVTARNSVGELAEAEGAVCLYTCADQDQFVINQNCGFGTQHDGLGGFEASFTSGENCN